MTARRVPRAARAAAFALALLAGLVLGAAAHAGHTESAPFSFDHPAHR
jgi:hypothetical protein